MPGQKRRSNRWKLLGIAGNCWELPEIAGNCRKLLGIAGNCWELPERRQPAGF
jgi:hypothetical protein